MIAERFAVTAPVQALFDSTDAKTRTGYDIYYALHAPSGLYALTSEQVYSDRVTVTLAGNPQPVVSATEDAAHASTIDVDFDIELKAPIDVRGKVIVEIPHGWRDTGNQTTYQAAAAYLQKVHNSSASTIVAMSGQAWLASNQTASIETKTALTVVSGTAPLTHFEEGDSIRLKVKCWTWESGGNPHWVFLGADPQGRITSDKDASLSGATLTFASGDVTTLRLFLPNVLDIG